MAALTPFNGNGAIDTELFARHAVAALSAGADSITAFGTTGECASLGDAERLAGLDALLDREVPPERIVIGVCATSAEAAAEQVGEAARRGVTRFLLLPPFYFKDVSDEGLLAWHGRVLASTPSEARFILYHIPQITQVSLSVSLVADLARLGEGRIFAVKDSAGDWSHTAALLAEQPLQVLVGDERLLHRAIRRGGAGAISGMVNLRPARMKRIVETGQEDPDLSAEVDRIVAHPVIAALKTRLARMEGERRWENIRPPLTPLPPAEREAVLADLMYHA